MFKKTESGFISKYQPIIYSTDAVIFTLPPVNVSPSQELVVIVHKRTNPDEPYFDQWALPGGMVRTNSDANDLAACERVVKDKLGIAPDYMEQLQTFSGAGRDPRGWSSSVVYFTLTPWDDLSDWWGTQPNALLIPLSNMRKKVVSLAFDHNEILKVAIERVQAKAHYSTLPCLLLPKHFTITQMHGMYEALQDSPINMAAFRRKIAKLDFLRKVNGVFEGGVQRPAQMYQMKERKSTLFDRGL
jgi:8-oxo-dGTP diphosphatase